MPLPVRTKPRSFDQGPSGSLEATELARGGWGTQQHGRECEQEHEGHPGGPVARLANERSGRAGYSSRPRILPAPRKNHQASGTDTAWFGNAESYFLIGDALGAEMVRLLKDKK